MDFNFILLFIESIPLQFDIFGGETRDGYWVVMIQLSKD